VNSRKLDDSAQIPDIDLVSERAWSTQGGILWTGTPRVIVTNDPQVQLELRTATRRNGVVQQMLDGFPKPGVVEVAAR
jgi:hypothetical protein